ncbi:MAG TPA: hypothetical protein VGI40_10755 [Pirellulaceae bacterium]|jgi:hypothetical protein
MTTKTFETDVEMEHALKLILSGKKNSEELRRAREKGDKFRHEMRAKYGPRSIAVELIREIRDGE